ncbi:uncharacterized protein TNCT_419681 [Trichonephila clavata]|uniref:Uncharacterized protein n=1 Tax=Trichonephila clavata TaxID=2740835 RepID=A0A8X6I2B7_TRICU|nr:uncharacterized protein TNCT_419681 [Trichonephila clavata]
MKFLVLCLCVVLATQSAMAEECTYTMEKMCSLVPNAKYTVRGCWYYCRIKAEFEVFTGTKLDGESCSSINGGVDGICKHGLCFPNQ